MGVKNINAAFSDDEFERLNSIKNKVGGSWEQFISEAATALAEQEGIADEDVEVEVEQEA